MSMPSPEARPDPMGYRVCTRCVMDTSDPEIMFDANGYCNHCTAAFAAMPTSWIRGDPGEALLRAKIEQMRQHRGEYDCILGLSGGLDSSYLAYEMVRRGLHPLIVHIDAGWNSDVAVSNIHSLVTKLGLELFTDVIDWDEMRDVQIAYLRAGLANQDTPQDHALFAGLYRYAVKYGIKYVLSGGNFATESILPRAWGYTPMDGRQLRAIHKQFGSRPLKHFPILTFRRYYLYYRAIRGMQVVRPLNWLPYDKRQAQRVLETEMGWRDYGGKHQESRWTKFFQHYYLPVYFGYDKRRAHLSSLIVSGQMTRDEALNTLLASPFDAGEIEIEIDFLSRKLGLSVNEFRDLLGVEKHDYRDFPNDEKFAARVGAGAIGSRARHFLRR